MPARPVIPSYADRRKNFTNPAALALLDTIERKQTNLCVAVDVTSKNALLAVADYVGPYICCLKTHIDIVQDFDSDLVAQLTSLAEKHDFVVFEDRKFADIGNTVKLQYEQGVYRIADWSHLTNAHILPGEGIIEGLKEVGLPRGRGLLLLAEMSSKGSLATGSYTDTAVEWARKHRDFVVGFIGQRRYYNPGDSTNTEGDFLYLTPGVKLNVGGDTLGQQYRTPRQVILESGCDVIIVGRGIYAGFTDEELIAGSSNAKKTIQERCEAYRKEGWKAYQDRCTNTS